MALHGKLLQQQLVVLLLIIGVLVLAASQPNYNSSCNRTCGSFNIPYPFGTDEGCYLDQSFLIICDHSFQPPKPFLPVDNIDILNISLDGELRVSNLVFRGCQYSSVYDNQPSLRRISALLNLSSLRISLEKNNFFALGRCNFFAYIHSSPRQLYTLLSACMSRYDDSTTGLVNGSCSDVFRYCNAPIKKVERNWIFNYNWTSNGYNDTWGNQCGLGFIGETQASYNFCTLYSENIPNNETVPLVLDLAIGNKTCKDAKKNKESYACKATHSDCYNSTNGLGYNCKCRQGYEGNPYLPDGQNDSCQGK